MTKLTNEELRKLLRQYAAVSYAYTVAERDSDDESKAEAKSDELEAEIIKRMAEGAAGEAAPPITDSDLYVRDIDGEITGMASEPENIPEAKSHLLAVLKQAIPSDDKIIIDHVVQAYLALGGGLNDFLASRPFVESGD